MDRFSIGGQVNAGGFYPYYVELEKEEILYKRLRVFGTNTSKGGARVRRTDSPRECRRQSYRTFRRTNFEEIR